MLSVGIDLGKRQSDVCVIDEAGKVVERLKLATTRAALSKRFANAPACKIAIESCRDSGWVFEHLTELGHEVIVIDTTRARAIGIGQGRRKTDRRDAEALARACRHGDLPRAHVLSRESRRVRDTLHTRDQMVRQRARLVTMVRGQFQGRGLKVPSCDTSRFAANLRAAGLPGVDAPDIQATLTILDGLSEQIEVLTKHLELLAQRQEAFDRLSSVHGVKLIVALAFIATIDDPTRFAHAHEVEAYLGLVPSELTTGGKRRLGRITRCGNPMARRLLVQAAHGLLRTRRAQEDPLVVWAKQIAARRGRKCATIALARRLAGVLWAMWVDGTYYDPKGLARQSFGGLCRRARLAQREATAMGELASQLPAPTATMTN